MQKSRVCACWMLHVTYCLLYKKKELVASVYMNQESCCNSQVLKEPQHLTSNHSYTLVKKWLLISSSGHTGLTHTQPPLDWSFQIVHQRTAGSTDPYQPPSTQTHTSTRILISSQDMRKSVLIMHGGTEREIMRPDRSRQAGWADWQFDLICTNGRLDGEGREEEEEEEKVWMAATVCSSNISWLRTSSKQASSLPWAFQWAVPCVQQTVCGGCVLVMCQVGEDHVFNQSSFPPQI